MIRRALVAFGFVVLCFFAGDAAAWAALPDPAPYPATGGAAAAWTCADSATTDTPPVTGSDCVVTVWAANPPVEPPPAPGDPAPALTTEQWQVLSFSLGLLVFLGAAHTVGSWRS